MTEKLSPEVLRDLCNLAAERSLDAAMDVIQLIDDPQQRISATLSATHMLLTLAMTLKMKMKMANSREVNYENLVDDFTETINKLMKANPPPSQMLKKVKSNQ